MTAHTLHNHHHLPLACEFPKDMDSITPTQMAQSSKPCPLQERLILFRLATWLPILRALESANAKSIKMQIPKLHKDAISLLETFPNTHQMFLPDTSWDSQCRFLPTHRRLVHIALHILILAIHRPHMLTNEWSMNEIFKSSNNILACQKKVLEYTDVPRYIMYTMAPSFFDAAIMLSTVLITKVYPHSPMLYWTISNIRMAADRLQKIGQEYKQARSNAAILQDLLIRVDAKQCYEYDARMTDKPASLPNSHTYAGGTVALDVSYFQDMDVYSDTDFNQNLLDNTKQAYFEAIFGVYPEILPPVLSDGSDVLTVQRASRSNDISDERLSDGNIY
jgi:hypothetical protein